MRISSGSSSHAAARRLFLAAIALTTGGSTAWAQDPEVPILVMEGPTEEVTDEEPDISRVIVSAAKRYETVDESPAIVTIVTRDQILSRGYRTLNDVVADVPGFEAARPDYYWIRNEPFARGNRRTVLILWNGVPMNSPEENQRTLRQALPLTVVDRVEVMSGPGGVFWGANAFLGIINVITLDASSAPYTTEVQLLGGTGPGEREAMGASLSFAESWLDGNVRLYANVSAFSSRSFDHDPLYDASASAFSPPLPDASFELQPPSGSADNDRSLFAPLTLVLHAGSVRFDVLYTLESDYRFPINERGLRGDYYRDPMTGNEFEGGSSTHEDEISMFAATYERALGASGRLVARAYYTGFNDHLPEAIQFAAGRYFADPVLSHSYYGGLDEGFRRFLRDGSYRRGGTVDASYAWPRHSVVGGIEAFNEGSRNFYLQVDQSAGGEPQPLSSAGSRFVMAAFANDRIKITNRFRLELGARGQLSPGGYDPIFLGSAAALWNPTGKMFLKANYAEGFRPPPIYLININDDPVENPTPHIPGNPDLGPERSRAFELEGSALVARGADGIRYLAIRGGYQLSLLSALVVRGSDTVPRNSGERTIHSAEARADLVLEGGAVWIGYTFLHAVDDATGPLRNVANHILSTGARLDLGENLETMVSALYIGPREDLDRVPDAAGFAAASSVVVDELPAHVLLRFGLRAKELWNDHFDAAIHVENALDSEYYVPDNLFEKRSAPYPMDAPGVAGFVTITARY